VERALPSGWNVGVGAPGPATRAPAGVSVTRPDTPPGSDPPPSLPGPDADSHCTGFMLRTQSRTCASVARQSRAR